MAQPLQWMPDSLYNYSLSAVVSSYGIYEKDIRTFHDSMIFDTYYKLYKDGLLLELSKEFESIDLFEKVLKVCDKRSLLHNAFQALMDHGYQTAYKLSEAYHNKCQMVFNMDFSEKVKFIQLGLSLGTFVTEAGWYRESELILISCLKLCHSLEPPDGLILDLECYKRLFRIRNCYCKFTEAANTFDELKACIQDIKKVHPDINLCSIYSEFSNFYFIQSNYVEAYRWSVKAILELNSTLPPREIVNVLRIAAKACVVKKQFKQADFLIKQAIQRAREHFEAQSLVFADVLLDYGYFLLQTDVTGHAVTVYQRALDIRNNILGGKNLLVAIAHEDLAYASYVYEYSSGRFNDARDHVKKALHIKEHLLSEDHFLLPSAKRVYALILEEIAIDSLDKELEKRIFAEAEELHMSALHITQRCLGEKNVQTGKHYGNLGRLYQSMRKYNDARKMHLRAISIKEEILGPNDHEVAISMGHLASLYNYDMELYEEAEVLYIKAIEIGLKQLGSTYSGLEYDYRGLLKVYSELGNRTKMAELHSQLHHWKMLRDGSLAEAYKTSPLAIDPCLVTPECLYDYFLRLDIR